MSPRVPAPPPLFFGRDDELERLTRGLEQTRAALILGVGGVGKSALAAVLASRSARPVVHHGIEAGQSCAQTLDRVRRELASGPVRQSLSDEERVDDLAERLDAAQALLVLDDLHHLGPAGHAIFLDRLLRRLSRGAVVATSREAGPLRAGGPDHVEVRLEGLGADAARQFWRSLDALYGPKSGLETALERSRGNPFLLKRAHAGNLFDDDPVAAALKELSPEERRVAGSLALAATPVPVEALLSAAGGEAGAVVRRLVVRMIVSVDGAGLCSLHDLFREPLRLGLAPAERQALHQSLARALREARELDPVTRIGEVCRHWVAAECFGEAEGWLLEHARELVRHGAASELLAALESIPPSARTREAQILRARTLGRMLQVRRAYEELRAMRPPPASDPTATDVSHRLALAEMAFLSARLEEAERLYEHILAANAAPVHARVRAQTSWVLLQSLRGRGDAARSLLDAAAEVVADPTSKAAMAFCKSFTLWAEGRWEEADGPMRLAMRWFDEAPPTFRGAVLFPLFAAMLLTCRGRLEEAEEVLRESAQFRRAADLRTLTFERGTLALLAQEQGERFRGIDGLRATAEVGRRGGEDLWAPWIAARLGDALLGVGRVREGLAVLEEAERTLSSGGVLAGAEETARLRRANPLLALLRGELEVVLPNQPRRARALAALQAACRGEPARRTDPPATRRDDLLDDALWALADAIHHTLSGDREKAAQSLAQATRWADEGGADPGLIADLHAALAPLSVVTPDRRTAAPNGAAVAPDGLVLDGREHVLSVRGGVRVSLAQRPVARRLLYALASRLGEHVSKERLVESAWSVEYHPLTHDNLLRVNIRRLRLALKSSSLEIAHDEAGYRLVAPRNFVYLAPHEE